MIRKLNQLVGLILATKLMTWAVPDTKKFIKGILITGIIILISIYLHSEYLSWSEISGNSKFITIRRRLCYECGHKWFTIQYPEMIVPDIQARYASRE